MNLDEKFNRMNPWITKFFIDGNAYGGWFDAMNDERIKQFFRSFPDVKTILELGSLEGGHSFALAQNSSVEKIIAIEARDKNLEKAHFIKELLEDEKVEFVKGNLEKTDLSKLGKFDAIFCSGLLYHLPKPWELIEQCCQISSRLFLSTQYAGEKEAKKFSNNLRGKWYAEGSWLDPLSGVSKYSFWLSMGSLINILTFNGYKNINIFDNNLSHPKGPLVTLAADFEAK